MLQPFWSLVFETQRLVPDASGTNRCVSIFCPILHLFGSPNGSQFGPFGLQNGSSEGSRWHLDRFSKKCTNSYGFLSHLGRSRDGLRTHLGTLLGAMLASKTLFFANRFWTWSRTRFCTHFRTIFVPFLYHFYTIFGFFGTCGCTLKNCTPMVRKPNFCIFSASKKRYKRDMVSKTILERLSASKKHRFRHHFGSQMALEIVFRRFRNDHCTKTPSKTLKNLQKAFKKNLSQQANGKRC